MAAIPHDYRELLEFGSYRIDVAQRVLLSGSQVVPLPPKAFDTLLVLVESRGRVVDKAELLKKVWPDTFVEEGSLAQNISTLRKVLGESPQDQKYINTVPKRGYRFIASVRAVAAEEAGAFVPGSFVTVEPRPSDSSALRSDSVQLPNRRIRFRRWVLAAVGLLLFTTGAVGLGWTYFRDQEAAPVVSIVVLPFLNLSDDQNKEYFSDGLTEEIIAALSSVPGLRVVARTTAFQFKGRADDVREIGRRLNVGAVLEGSVRREGDRIRVTVRLNSVEDGFRYWSRSWDKELKDVFAVQEEIARQVTNSLWPNGGARLPIVRPLTTNVDAYNLYLQGEFHSRRVATSLNTSLNRAMGFFRQAIDKDPKFAEAHVGLAICYNRAANTGQLRPAEAYPQSKAALQRALALNPSLASAYAAEGWISFHYDWNWLAAEQQLRRAIEASPASTEPYHAYSHFLAAMGRFAESLDESRRAIEVDPLDSAMRAHLAWNYNVTRDPEQAIQAAQAALEIDPVHPDALAYMGRAYESIGQLHKAVDVLARQSEPSELIRMLRERLAAAGPQGYWSTLRDDEFERSRKQYVGAENIARASARLGQKREAIEWLERGFREREGWLVYLNVLSDFDDLRGEPQFQEIVRRVGLP